MSYLIFYKYVKFITSNLTFFVNKFSGFWINILYECNYNLHTSEVFAVSASLDIAKGRFRDVNETSRHFKLLGEDPDNPVDTSKMNDISERRKQIFISHLLP